VLRASVPAGARNGNPGGMLVIPLPAGIADPGQRLQAITAETARRKSPPRRRHRRDRGHARQSSPAGRALSRSYGQFGRLFRV